MIPANYIARLAVILRPLRRQPSGRRPAPGEGQKTDRFLPGFILAVGLLLAAMGGISEAADVPLPKTTVAKGVQCVEEPAFMRKNHMDILKHQRDETLRQGVRGGKHSLKDCVNCHVVKGRDDKPVGIESKDHFCASCHGYAAVKVDCFECHASTPEVREAEKR
jgi:hypothetical protein